MNNLLRALSTLCLLLVFFLLFIQFEFIHEMIHTHEEVTHTYEEERDPCHRITYHGDTNQRCDHTGHLSKNRTCFFYQLSLKSELVLPKKIEVALQIDDTRVTCLYCLIEKQEIFELLPSRAPPTF